ncbi:MAG: magnesium/cobalt transporter CorA [Fimbriimonas sp.]
MADTLKVDPPGIDAPLVIRAAAQDGKGCTLVDEKQAVQLINRGRAMIWLDILVRDQAAAKEFLSEKLDFHELAVEDALSEYERPTLQEFREYLFFSLPALFENHGPDQYVEIGFFLKEHAVITVRSQPVRIIDEWFERWRAHPDTMQSSAAVLLHSIMDGIVDSYFPVVDRMEDEIDELSDAIFSGDTGKVKDILVLKKHFLEFRRRVAPVRDILNALLRRDLVLVPSDTKPYFQDVLDHVIRISEMLDVNRETLASLLDVHLSQVSNNLNLVVKKMTVVATVMMVMTLVAGIYGMNFDYMPELHWRFGYPFAILLMLVLGGLTLWGFKRSKWL